MQSATPRATEAGEPNASAVDPAGRGGFAPFLAALRQDFARGLGLRELWLYLGWRDVQKHYRRTMLGPFWLTLSMGVLVAGLGVLYSQIFSTPIREYLPYIAVGFIVWTLIGTSLNGALQRLHPGCRPRSGRYRCPSASTCSSSPGRSS